MNDKLRLESVAELYHTILAGTMENVNDESLTVGDIEKLSLFAGVYQISMTEWSLKEAQKHREFVEALFTRQTEAIEAIAAAIQRMAHE